MHAQAINLSGKPQRVDFCLRTPGRFLRRVAALLVLLNLTVHAQAAPDSLVVGPADGLVFYGSAGAISGTNQVFNLTNIGVAPLSWSVASTSSWFTVSSGSGTLSGGGNGAVLFTVNNAADSLAVGNYTNTVWFTNQDDGFVQSRSVVLVVQPLVSNGGFETGNFSGWTTSGNFQYSTVVSSPANYIHSGTWAAEMGPSDTLGYLSQTLNTTPGRTYLLSFWLNNPRGQTPNEFTAAWNGNVLVDLVNLETTNWVNYQYLVTATSNRTVIQFGFHNDPDYWAFDDVSVTPVPDSNFLSATLSGNNLNLSWNAQTGSVYQVQYTTNLAPANWINLGAVITAVGSSLTATDTDVIVTSPQRFYRFQILP